MLSEVQSAPAQTACNIGHQESAGATPGPYLIEGRTVYALEHAGWARGAELVRNRFSAQVQAAHTPESEVVAVATLFHAAPDLLAAAECDEALGMGEAGWQVLEGYGWDRHRRFSLTATEFVTRLRRAAIAKATIRSPAALQGGEV